MSCHLFISPHLDDAILSCGARIYQLAQKGENPIIITTMAGEPSEHLPSTPLIEAIRTHWSSGRNLVASRLKEDDNAAFKLGAQTVHLPIQEAVFRIARSGDGSYMALYPTEGSVYGDRNVGDDAHIMLFDTPIPRKDAVMIYAPIGADEHIDHRLARDWGIKLAMSENVPLRFYEEFPAATIDKRAKVKKNTAYFQNQTPPYQLHTVISTAEEADVKAKILALRAYDHHFKVLWNSAEAMEQSVRTFMTATGGGTLAERFWNVKLG